MTFSEASYWARTEQTRLPYGKNASWGLYTAHMVDAIKMAFHLGGMNLPVFDTGGLGVMPHFHIHGRIFNEKYKHFHIWFGVVNG